MKLKKYNIVLKNQVKKQNCCSSNNIKQYAKKIQNNVYNNTKQYATITHDLQDNTFLIACLF